MYWRIYFPPTPNSKWCLPSGLHGYSKYLKNIVVETLTFRRRCSMSQGRSWQTNTSLVHWLWPCLYWPCLYRHKVGMGVGAWSENLSSTHFGIHFKVTFLPELWFWLQRSLLLLCSTNPLQSDSPTELPPEYKGNIFILCSSTTWRELLPKQAIQWLLLNSFCPVPGTQFQGISPSTCLPAKGFHKCIPCLCYVSQQEFSRRIRAEMQDFKTPKSNLTFDFDYAMVTLPCD